MATPRLLLLTALLITFTGAGLAADFEADQTEIEWIEPFDPETKDMPAHFESDSEIQLIARLDDNLVGSNPGDFDFKEKLAKETAFTDLDGTNIKERFHHGADKSSNVDYAANVYMFNKDSTYNLAEGESVTFTVNGNEHTVEEEDVDLNANPNEVMIRVDGGLESMKMGEYVSIPDESGKYIRLIDTYDDLSNGPSLEFGIFESDYSPEDDNYDLKAVAEVDSSDTYHSEPLYYDFYTVDGYNVPYVESLSYDGKELSSVSSNSGLEIGDTLVATVKKEEADPYNVTLVDRSSGQELISAEVNENGVIQRFRDFVLNSLLGTFMDVSAFQSGDTAEIPLKLTPEANNQVDFLNTVNGTYQLGVKVDDEFLTRNTVDYSVETDQSAEPPTVESIEASGDCSTYQSIDSFNNEENQVGCIKVTASDPDTDASSLGVSLNLTHEYDGIDYFETTEYSNFDSRNGYEYVFNTSSAQETLFEFGESGSWMASARVTDGLASDTEVVEWTVPWGDLQVEMVTPDSDFTVLNNESFSMDLRVSCSGGPECVNQNESVSLFWDPVKQSSDSGFLQNLWDRIVEVLQ